MARKLTRHDVAERPYRGIDAEDRRPSRSGRFAVGRRGYLKLGGAALAIGAGLPLSGQTVAAESNEYDTITLEPGQQLAYHLSDGEAFENVLIDQTAENAMFALMVEEDAEDWAIRNVGWKGVAPSGGNREHTFLIHVRGNGVIENVFIDQRNHEGGVGSDVGGIWTYSDSHHGHIECRHNFIAGCGNNASYPSGDGWAHNSSSGTIEHYRSYHRDNTVANYRPGNPGSIVRECVSVVNDPDGTRGGYPSTGSQLSRAVWGWHNPDLHVEDCAIWHDPEDVQPADPFWTTWSGDSAGDRSELHVVDCDINESWEEAGNPLTPPGAGGNADGNRNVVIENLGTEPDISILGDGVPTTPEMAAQGRRNLPPELGTAPSGGVGEFEEEEEEVEETDDEDQSPSTVEPQTLAYEPERVTEEPNPPADPTYRRSGMTVFGGILSMGVAGYILRDAFDWEE